MMNIFIGFEDKIEDCKNFLFNYKKKKKYQFPNS